MHRNQIDKIVSSIGILLAVVLLAASVVLYFTYGFIHGQVSDQLSSQKIFFPKTSDEAFKSLPADSQAAIQPFAGQQLTTGAGAEVFADHYIAIHLEKIGGGLTYSELSAKSMADPSNQELAGKVDTVFRGETLRGVLLNAYAFDTMAVVAKFVAIGAFVAGLILIPLSYLGFRHAKKVKPGKK